MDPIEDFIIRIYINEYITILKKKLEIVKFKKRICSFIVDITNLYKFGEFENLESLQKSEQFQELMKMKNKYYSEPIISKPYKFQYSLIQNDNIIIIKTEKNEEFKEHEIFIQVINKKFSLQTNLLHYLTGASIGLYWGYPVYDNNLECFASPFNHTSPNYCSLFTSDLKPNFADLTYQQIKDYKACVVNPPFTELMFNLTVEKIKSFETFKGIFIFAHWEDLIKIFESTFKIIKSKKLNYTYNLMINKKIYNMQVYIAAFTYNCEDNDNYLENYIDKF